MTGISPILIPSACADTSHQGGSNATIGSGSATRPHRAKYGGSRLAASASATAASAASAVSDAASRTLSAAGYGVTTALSLPRLLGRTKTPVAAGEGKSGPGLASRPRAELERQLRRRMGTATSFQEWETAARELDVIEGNAGWKLDRGTGELDADLIERRLRELNAARARDDVTSMTHLVRTALSRDLGGMGRPALYRRCHVGTKHLVERYVEAAIRTIDAVVDSSSSSLASSASSSTAKPTASAANSTPAAATANTNPSPFPPPDRLRDLLDAMLSARQSFGRSALLLSGGGTLGMAHIGVVKALFEARLLPRIVSGASAGSIVGAVLCTRIDDEIPDLVQSFPYGDMGVFDATPPLASSPSNPSTSCSSSAIPGFASRPPAPLSTSSRLLNHLRLLLTEGSWANIRHLIRVVRGLVGDLTFQEAYNRTRRILNICVSTASVYELPRLLNYVTAPNVLIWSAVAASCSVPFVFGPASLLVKDPISGAHAPWDPTPLRWIDGSVENDLPMTRLAELFNVNHFIVSQVNPHVVPFLSRHRYDSGSGPVSWTWRNTAGVPTSLSPHHPAGNWASILAELARDEVLHRLHFLAELGIVPNLATKLRSILSQKYSGDITILPEFGLHQLPLILTNPTPEFMLLVSLQGERATWPVLDRVRDRCAIELALDHAVHRLRARVVFSTSQVELRRLATAFSPWTGERAPHSAAAVVGAVGADADDATSSSRWDLYHHQLYHPQSSLRLRRRSGGSLHLRYLNRYGTPWTGAEDHEYRPLLQPVVNLNSGSSHRSEHDGARHDHQWQRLVRRMTRSHYDMRDSCGVLGPHTAPARSSADDRQQGLDYFVAAAAAAAVAAAAAADVATSRSGEAETSAEDPRWSDAEADYSRTDGDDSSPEHDPDETTSSSGRLAWIHGSPLRGSVVDSIVDGV